MVKHHKYKRCAKKSNKKTALPMYKYIVDLVCAAYLSKMKRMDVTELFEIKARNL